MKKKMSVLLAGLLALGLSACGGTGGDNATADNRADKLYTWLSNDADRQQWQTFVDGVKESSDPDFNLKMEGPNYPEYWTLVRTRLSASDAPCLVTSQGARTKEISELLAPLDELVKKAGIDISKYNDAMISGMTVDGTLRAIPYDAEPMMLYYNKTLFEEKGLATPDVNYTREQFLADAKTLSEDGKRGFFLATDPVYPYLVFAFADGATVVKDGEMDLTDQDLVDQIQWVMDLASKENVANPPNPGDTDANGRAEFYAGNVGMIIDGPWVYTDIMRDAPFEVGVAVPPSSSGKSKGIIQGSGFGIAESCPDKEAAFENIVKLTSSSVIGKVAAERGTVPSLSEVMDQWASGKEPVHVGVVEALLNDSLPLETTKDWNQFVTQFNQYSLEGTRGNKSAEDVMKAIEQGLGK